MVGARAVYGALMDDDFLTVAEVAALLKLNQQTVRNWIDEGRLSALHVGRRVRIKRSDFQRFLEGDAAGRSLERPVRAPAHNSQPTELWPPLWTALAEVSSAVARDDGTDTARALRSLADAAAELAEAISRTLRR